MNELDQIILHFDNRNYTQLIAYASTVDIDDNWEFYYFIGLSLIELDKKISARIAFYKSDELYNCWETKYRIADLEWEIDKEAVRALENFESAKSLAFGIHKKNCDTQIASIYYEIEQYELAIDLLPDLIEANYLVHENSILLFKVYLITSQLENARMLVDLLLDHFSFESSYEGMRMILDGFQENNKDILPALKEDLKSEFLMEEINKPLINIINECWERKTNYNLSLLDQ